MPLISLIRLLWPCAVGLERVSIKMHRNCLSETPITITSADVSVSFFLFVLHVLSIHCAHRPVPILPSPGALAHPQHHRHRVPPLLSGRERSEWKKPVTERGQWERLCSLLPGLTEGAKRVRLRACTRYCYTAMTCHYHPLWPY